MKKITALLLAIVATAAMAVGIVGCAGGGASSVKSEPTPSDAVSGLLDAIKALDAEACSKYYAGEVPESLDYKALIEKDQSLGSLTDEQKAVITSGIEKVLDFDYVVGNEQIDEDKATVDVTFTTYNFGGFVKTIKSDLVQQFTGKAGQEKGGADVYGAIQKALDSLTQKNVSSTVTVNVSKDADGNWKVDDIATMSQDQRNKLSDALFGDIMTEIEGLARILISSFDMSVFNDIADQVTTDKAA